MITITPAALSDLLIINELAHRIWPLTYQDILKPEQLDYMLDKLYSLTSLKAQAEERGNKFIIVYDDKTPVGFASYSPKAEDSNIYRLHKIYILAEEQGKNIGKKIMDYIINDIKPKGAKSLELNVNRHNKARFFYEKLGFKIIREEDINIGQGYFMNDYIMDKDLIAE